METYEFVYHTEGTLTIKVRADNQYAAKDKARKLAVQRVRNHSARGAVRMDVSDDEEGIFIYPDNWVYEDTKYDKEGQIPQGGRKQ